MANTDIREFLNESAFCDYKESSIQNLSERITKGLKSEREKAVAVFFWVRDNVKYRVGLWQKPASQTLSEKKGTCTNKANLVVALLRANNIPAGYGILRTRGQDYIGPVVIPILRKRISDVSTHIYAFVFLDDKWIKCDPSADIELSKNTVHLNPQSRLVIWDGEHDGTEDLDENHILSETGPIANIDHIMRKQSRNGRGVVIKVANLYVEFLRSHAGKARNIKELEELFFRWLDQEGNLKLLVWYFRVISKLKDRSDHINERFWGRYMSVYDVMEKAIPYQKMLNEVIIAGHFQPRHKVLDAGSGTGLISRSIKKICPNVVSVDNSSSAIQIHKHHDSSANIIKADLREKLPFPDCSFDRVSCVHTLHVLAPHDREIAIKEFYRVLKPSGQLVIVSPSINFNSIRIFSEHVRDSIGQKGVMTSMLEISKMLVPITKMFYYNFILEFRKNSYRYLEFNEQLNYLNKIGFSTVSSSREIYAKSAVINWAIK